MELNCVSVHHVIHPTAAFLQRPQRTARRDDTSPQPWERSQLNPKNRIDSLDLPVSPLWRIDGCTGLGTQYYALPLFIGDTPPVHFDVFVPEEATASPLLRQLLDLDAAFHTKDATRLLRLGITRHIIRALQFWTESGRGGPESVSALYSSLPFGSRIIFENLDLNIRNIKITVASTYFVENHLLTLSRLPACLGLAPSLLPESIDIYQLAISKQLHDSVCLVHLKLDPALGGGAQQADSKKLWIFKALTSGTKYMYSELRNLLQLAPHPHVITRPRYLVTKFCRFGGKKAVVGFIIPYHPAGSLRDILPLLRIRHQLNLATQLKWATQLTSAVLHVRERGGIFYPDLRLDNIVLSESGDVVMVDFEQRGVWCEFAAPEVNALEYTRILATGESVEDEAETIIPDEVRGRFAAILTRELPDWDVIQSCEDYVPMPEGYGSYNIPWLCLSPTEQEAAEVYMLGRVLWCIFEGQSAPQRSAVWQSYRWEPEIEFPEFRRTPMELRALVDHCTRGRRDVLCNLVTRRGSKLVLCADVPERTNVDGEAGAAEVLRAAADWWTSEVKAAEEFLQMRWELKTRGEWKDNYFGRPSLREVIALLDAYQARVDSAESNGIRPSVVVA
ncbi:hypothetical protein B0T22DRAFT_49134 [Podospora appendiculata]|uniref:Protein kinase domain-containing protein n=1 Tax=Podospora appendiculata TaxID=314037 RepID=A0AAE1CGQ9_9PEZI|nr:hypothetical protein B0T22DRAFT_49134 [Podospora appendiculata]